MVGIYKITSPSNRIYIGQSINMEKRWKKHKYERNRLQHKLYNSFKKYGVENHIFEKVEECSIEQLNERERYWQDYYNVLDGGLNCCLTNTNTKSGCFSDEHKSNITKAKLGKKQKEGYGLKMKLLLTGQTRTKETIKLITLHRNTKEHNDAVVKAKSKPINQYDLNGNFIKEWPSGKEASRVLKLQQSGINAVCNNKGKTHGGFIWKFKDI